jgi:hypothetical protein
MVAAIASRQWSFWFRKIDEDDMVLSWLFYAMVVLINFFQEQPFENKRKLTTTTYFPFFVTSL